MLRPSSPISRSYIARRPGFTPEAGAGGLGPNLLTASNGPFAVAPWTPIAVTETTGQTDPFGGTTASLITDNAVSSPHDFVQSTAPLTNGALYQLTWYFKPGTYTGGCFGSFTYGVNTQAFAVTNAGVGTMFDTSGYFHSVTTVGGFFKCVFQGKFGVGGVSQVLIAFSTNVGAPTYVGSSQNQTFWGVVFQQVYP